MEHEDFPAGLRQPPACRLEMSGHDLILAYIVIGEKAASRLGVGPILAGIRNTFTDFPGHHPQQFTEPFGQTHIFKTTPSHFIINPSVSGRMARDSQ